MLLHRFPHFTTFARFHNPSFPAPSSSSSRPNPNAFHHLRNPQYLTIPSSSPTAWISKVISILYLKLSSHALDKNTQFQNLKHFIRQVLTQTPVVAHIVVCRFNRHPKLALGFFQFARSNIEFNHSLATYNLLIKTLCRVGLNDSAKAVFDCMRSDRHLPDGSVLGFLASSYMKAGKYDSAMGLLSLAHQCECRPNAAIYNNLLNRLVKSYRVNDAVCFFRGSYFQPDTFTFNIIIKGLCRLGDIEQAFELFGEMGSFGCHPDIVTYNTLIDGLCRAKKVDRGHEMLNEIRSKGVCLPDVMTYTSIVSGYCKIGKMEEASCIFYEMIAFGIRPSLITYNVLIDGYGKAADMESAMSMYVKLLSDGCSPDVVTFTSLIDGYCRSGQVDDAMKVWQEMSGKNLSPNAYTFAIVINALCKENRLNEAHNLLTQLIRSNILPQPFMYNPVVDGFCKAGNVDEANRIIAEMEERGCIHDKYTYTILTIGHCMKGRMLEAIDLFNKMLAIGCAPDTIIANSLISCLLKAGMPHEANRIVISVSSKDFDMDLGSSREIFSFKKHTDIPVAV